MVAMGMLPEDTELDELPEPINEEDAMILGDYEDFMTVFENLTSVVAESPSTTFFVSKENTDEFGFPMTNNLPELYGFLWTNYNYLFNPDQNYWWSQPADVVMNICSDLWMVADYTEQSKILYDKQIKEYEEAMAKYETDLEDQERLEEEEIAERFKLGLVGKQKNMKRKKGVPPPKPAMFKKVPKRLLAKKEVVIKPTVSKNTKLRDIDEDKILEEAEIVPVDESRKPASLIFIGHVDAGKSTICGQLMYLTGTVDERTIKQYKKEAESKGRDSWWLAYVMDINDEEKAKGKTVEVGRATLET